MELGKNNGNRKKRVRLKAIGVGITRAQSSSGIGVLVAWVGVIKPVSRKPFCIYNAAVWQKQSDEDKRVGKSNVPTISLFLLFYDHFYISRPRRLLISVAARAA